MSWNCQVFSVWKITILLSLDGLLAIIDTAKKKNGCRYKYVFTSKRTILLYTKILSERLHLVVMVCYLLFVWSVVFINIQLRGQVSEPLLTVSDICTESYKTRKITSLETSNRHVSKVNFSWELLGVVNYGLESTTEFPRQIRILGVILL